VAPDSDSQPIAGRGAVFIPEGSPMDAIRTYTELLEAREGQAMPQFPDSALKDLRALHLIIGTKDIMMVDTQSASPEIQLRRAVSQMESIRISRAVLRVNPNATGSEIAEAVAMELRRSWPKPATKKRNGNALRRWTIWLEPHLIDPNESAEAAALVAYATEVKRRKQGRPPSLREALERRLREYMTLELSKAEIARRLKVSPATIANWMEWVKAQDAING
jgi:hypothetical protein